MKYNDSKAPNLKFYKNVNEQNINTFDAYTLTTKGKNINDFSGSYLALENNQTKNIDIYTIHSKDYIYLFHTIKIGFEDINIIKYYYDSYYDSHYLLALINAKTKVLIYKITHKCQYDLIFNQSDIRSQGGISSREESVHYRWCELIFNKENSFLILFYVLQQGCCHRNAYCDIIDFIKNEKYELNRFYQKFIIDESIKNIYDIKKGDKNYIGFLKYNKLYLYDISPSNLIKDSNKKIQKVEMLEIWKEQNKVDPRNYNGVLINENNGDECLYIYQSYSNIKDIYIWKTSLKNKQIIYRVEINTYRINYMLFWNKKFSLIFEENGNILLFNMKKGRVENKFNNGNDIFHNGKKIVINDKEELLFVKDNKGVISLCVNS